LCNAFEEKAMQTIGNRLKVWRETVSMRQGEAAAMLGLHAGTYQNYERDVRAPNAEGFQAFVRAGINANWLLMGEGQMLLAAEPKQRPTVVINEEALESVIRAVETVRGGASQAKRAALIASMYMKLVDMGMVTPDGDIPDEKQAD
jgi:transcriptional regulator with XRE-family HTH domain